ncbi:MAG: hypothetical protein RR413_11990 [Christensenellaceae bacterium]
MMCKSKMRKTRPVSLFLAFVMLFGIIPVSVIATANAIGGVTLLVDSNVSYSAESRQNNAKYKYLSDAYRLIMMK